MKQPEAISTEKQSLAYFFRFQLQLPFFTNPPTFHRHITRVVSKLNVAGPRSKLAPLADKVGALVSADLPAGTLQLLWIGCTDAWIVQQKLFRKKDPGVAVLSSWLYLYDNSNTHRRLISLFLMPAQNNLSSQSMTLDSLHSQYKPEPLFFL